MATPAETFVSLTAVGNREDLTDDMKLITPQSTPFYSSIASRKAKATLHEWQTEDLRAPALGNAKLEGDDAVMTDPVNSERLGNRVQRFEETWSVSGTQEAVDRAGVASDIEKQKLRKALLLRRDIEITLLSAQASNEQGQNAVGAAAAGAPRRMGGAQTFFKSNVSRGSGGANGGFGQGNMQAPVAGTARAFTEAQLVGVLGDRFENSGEVDVPIRAFMSRAHKEQFGTFAGLSETRDTASRAKGREIIGSVDVYVSHFGEVVVTPVAYGLDDAVLLVQPSYWKRAVLRRMTSEVLAKKGDRTEGMITCEETLVCLNEKSGGVIADLS